jgi:hypothetical protein
MKTRFLKKAQSSCYQVVEPSKIYPFHKSASLATIERAQLSPGHSPWSTTDARVLQPYQALRARSALLSGFVSRGKKTLEIERLLTNCIFVEEVIAFDDEDEVDSIQTDRQHVSSAIGDEFV